MGDVMGSTLMHVNKGKAYGRQGKLNFNTVCRGVPRRTEN